MGSVFRGGSIRSVGTFFCLGDGKFVERWRWVWLELISELAGLLRSFFFLSFSFGSCFGGWDMGIGLSSLLFGFGFGDWEMIAG